MLYDNATMTEPLEIITHEPTQTADACVIWLHGLGADGHDFENILPELGLPESHRIRFIFPHAPMRSITINNNMRVRGWYDIYSLNKLEKEDKEGIEQSRLQVENLVQQQIDQGIATERIVIAGFSQGGAIALHFGLNYSDKLAGIIGLSTYLPFMENGQQATKTSHKNRAILLCHGEYDDILPIQLGEMTLNYLNKKGFTPQWHTYPMTHQVCMEEIKLIGKWLENTITS